jgi:hypothetical protein
MLQYRLLEHTLVELWPTLNLEQKKCAMRRVTEIVLNLHEITNASAGIISRVNNTSDLVNGVKLEPYPISKCSISRDDIEPKVNIVSPPQTTQDLLHSLCKSQRPLMVADNGNLMFQDIWDDLESIISTLHNRGFIPDGDLFHLCHFDLQSRNLLARFIDESTVDITGILDWDSAAFAPKFMRVRAPFFSWINNDDWEEDEIKVNRTLQDPEHVALKAVYEKTAGTEFARASYVLELAMVRQLFYVLKKGITGGIVVELAEEINEEFAKLNIK